MLSNYSSLLMFKMKNLPLHKYDFIFRATLTESIIKKQAILKI